MVNIVKYRWTLDTCNCIIEYTGDTDDPDFVRTPTAALACSAHASLSGNLTNFWNEVRSESEDIINPATDIILQNSPTSVYDIVNGIRVLKSTVSRNASWSGVYPNRVLTITLTGVSLTNNQKNTIRSALNSIYGSGKIVFG